MLFHEYVPQLNISNFTVNLMLRNRSEICFYNKNYLTSHLLIVLIIIAS